MLRTTSQSASLTALLTRRAYWYIRNFKYARMKLGVVGDDALI